MKKLIIGFVLAGAVSALVLVIGGGVAWYLSSNPHYFDFDSRLSKKNITRMITNQSASTHDPVIIDSISEPQKMVLHEETLLTAVAFIKTGLLPMPIQFVNKGTATIWGGSIIDDVNEKGFDAVAKDVTQVEDAPK
jgi:hypothetical protein